MNEPTGVAADAATSIFNLPDYRVISTSLSPDGGRRVIVETDQPPGCPTCGVVAPRRKERRFQRIRDIPVAGPVEVLWSKYRWYCEEPACERLSFFESTVQVPRRARSTGRLRDQLVDAVIRSGRAVWRDCCRVRGVLVDGPDRPERSVLPRPSGCGSAEPENAGHR